MKKLLMPLACLTLLITFGCAKRYRLPEGHTLHVEEEAVWEINQKLYYRITKDGETVVPNTFFGFSEEGHLKQFTSKEGVVGFVQENRPNDVVIVFDPKTGDSWPYQKPHETGSEARKRGQNMVEALTTQQGQEALSLNSQ